ncbi:MAG: hypothetical protein U9Q21_02465 [Candidatus Auribacterota bacterium]|nr:hypothetical protein [Candidatus Auribacterota bacterium]
MCNCRPDSPDFHLCDSCNFEVPTCPAGPDDIVFGNGVGLDNVIECRAYSEDPSHIHK